MAMVLRLSEDEDHQLTELARSSNVSKTQLVSSLVREKWIQQQRRQKTFTLLDQINDDYSDVIERLGQ